MINHPLAQCNQNKKHISILPQGLNKNDYDDLQAPPMLLSPACSSDDYCTIGSTTSAFNSKCMSLHTSLVQPLTHNHPMPPLLNDTSILSNIELLSPKVYANQLNKKSLWMETTTSSNSCFLRGRGSTFN